MYGCSSNFLPCGGLKCLSTLPSTTTNISQIHSLPSQKWKKHVKGKHQMRKVLFMFVNGLSRFQIQKKQYGAYNMNDSKIKSIIVTLSVTLILSLFLMFTPGFYKEHQVTGIVLDKERVMKDSSSYYLIYLDDETLTIQDSWVKGQFRSSDIYGHIEQGKEYKFTVYGWRSGIFSMYRNIIKVELQKEF
jgi:hypothetical protein